MLAYTGRP